LTKKSKNNAGSNRKSEKQGNYSGSKKSARIVLIGIAGGIAGILALAIFMSGGFTNKFVGPAEQRAALMTQALAPTTPNAYALEAENTVGSSSSPRITIIEFGDYQCNSCGRFHKETKAQVISDLVDTGKVKFMFKDFPINDRVYAPRDGSTMAAEAAYCAGDQGKFWQYHDELYNRQQKEGIEWVSGSALNQFAKNVGVKDLGLFSQCVDSHLYRDKVIANYKLAVNLGLNATPTFVIFEEGKDPQVVVGAQPYTTFERVVNEMSMSS
jgi:protein-disulfide isomerase